jgi:hypothetical protein
MLFELAFVIQRDEEYVSSQSSGQFISKFSDIHRRRLRLHPAVHRLLYGLVVPRDRKQSHPSRIRWLTPMLLPILHRARCYIAPRKLVLGQAEL